MRVLEIRDITKKHLHIHYRNEFKGAAVFEYSIDNREEVPVEFAVEHSADGVVDISAKMLGKLNYPLLPAMKSLKDHIRGLDMKGKLL